MRPILLVQLTLIYAIYCWRLVSGCKSGDKQLGVCLHVYLERDFLALEKIVYPPSRLYSRTRSYGELSALRKNAPDRSETSRNDNRAKQRIPSNYSSGKRDWVEGPELEEYCKKLREVITCFEAVLVDCETGYDFFRYRHLLYSLGIAHDYVCSSPTYRKDRFLQFLKTINCAEKARRVEVSCHRHNVSLNVWNQILRAEVGEEICDSLNTQRSCLLNYNYIKEYCEDEISTAIYTNLSEVFLSTWCRLPLSPGLELPSSNSCLGCSSPLMSVIMIIVIMTCIKEIVF